MDATMELLTAHDAHRERARRLRAQADEADREADRVLLSLIAQRTQTPTVIPPMVLASGDRVMVMDGLNEEGLGTVTKVDGGLARVEMEDGNIGIFNQTDDPRIKRV